MRRKISRIIPMGVALGLVTGIALALPQPSHGASFEWSRFHGGVMVAYESRQRYSISPVAAWAPRARFGEKLFLATPLSLSALKGQFVTSALFDLGLTLGWKALFHRFSPQIGLGTGYMTGAPDAARSFVLFAPRAALFWELPGEPFLSITSVGTGWSYAAGTFDSGGRGFRSYHRIELLLEVRW